VATLVYVRTWFGVLYGALAGLAFVLVAARLRPVASEVLLATIDAGDDRASIATELALHGLVYEASGHRLLQRAWHGLRGRLQLYWAAHHRAHGRRGPRRDSHAGTRVGPRITDRARTSCVVAGASTPSGTAMLSPVDSFPRRRSGFGKPPGEEAM